MFCINPYTAFDEKTESGYKDYRNQSPSCDEILY